MAQPSTAPKMKIHDPYRLYMAEQEKKATVTRAEFDKRVNAPSRLDAIEAEMGTIKQLLREITTRLNAGKK